MAQNQKGALLTCTATSSLVLLCLGLAVIAVGLLVPGAVDKRLKAGIWESVVWTPDSPADTDARFRGLPDPDGPPDIFNVWMFNITNIEEVRAGALPKLEQVGPFVHRAYHEKLDAVWDAEGRVMFKDYTHYHLDPDLTPVNLTANITTFNLALLGVLANLHGSVSPEYRPFVDVLMQAISRLISLVAEVREAQQLMAATSCFLATCHRFCIGAHGISYAGSPGNQGVFTTRPAMDLLWGYQDPLLQLLVALLPPGSLRDGSTVRLLRNTSSPDEARARAPITFNTGHKDPKHIWNIEADQGWRVVSSWPCDPEPVHGSDASQFQPGLDEGSAVDVWISDLFQARRLVVNSSVELHGVNLLRFWLDPAQSAPTPCRSQEVQGLMNITIPQAVGFDAGGKVSGPYVFVSMPMFCGADEALAADAGLTCDMERHMTWVDVEPLTGITMRVYKRLMMSSRVGELASVLDPAVRHNLTVPMFWAEEAVAVTPEVAAQFKARVYRAVWVVHHLAKWCWLGGGLLVLLGIILAVLTVELAADPDKWPGRSDAVMAVAQRMFRVTSTASGLDDREAAAAAAAAAESSSGVAAASTSGLRSTQDSEEGLRQPLLQSRAAGDQQPAEIVAE